MSNIDPRWGSWALPPKPFEPEEFEEVQHTQVLVIGAGIAGLSCAYSASLIFVISAATSSTEGIIPPVLP